MRISLIVVLIGGFVGFIMSCRTPQGKGESNLQNTGGSGSRLIPLNLEAGSKVLYEMQFRSANACDPTVGSSVQKEACKKKTAPKTTYRAKGMTCSSIADLQRIKMGTIDDAMEKTSDYRSGITLKYVEEKVGANMLWIMPMFPNNDIEDIPHECDDLGSPYAVRDYMHARGTLSRECIGLGRDEYSDEPCWANDEFDQFLEDAKSRGIKVMLDVAFNHFGHNYLMYDYQEYKTISERIEDDEDLDKLWDINATYEEELLNPKLLDSEKSLKKLAAIDSRYHKYLTDLQTKCPALKGNKLVIAFNNWRNTLENEKSSFDCTKDELESRSPGFYMGQDRQAPSVDPESFFTNNWRDVKFLYHKESNPLKQHEMIRNREYLFRVMNYWVSRGVEGFRLDHATDEDSGLSPNTWHYIISKVNFYAAKRGQSRPIYMAEEFHNQHGMDRVIDFMTEGYVTGINARGGGNKNTPQVESVLKGLERFPNQSYTMTALETHDELRLMAGTGFNQWTGAGFWGIGATTRSTPMILMGQEFGASRRLGFKHADYIRSRFEGSSHWNPKGEELRAYYQSMITGRLAKENRALTSQNYHFLRTTENKADERIFAQVKWSDDLNVVFVFHNLWEQDVRQTFFIPPNIANAIAMKDDTKYKMVDIISGKVKGDCRKGKDIKYKFPVILDSATRAQWLRLETCA